MNNKLKQQMGDFKFQQMCTECMITEADMELCEWNLHYLDLAKIYNDAYMFKEVREIFELVDFIHSCFK